MYDLYRHDKENALLTFDIKKKEFLIVIVPEADKLNYTRWLVRRATLKGQP